MSFIIFVLVSFTWGSFGVERTDSDEFIRKRTETLLSGYELEIRGERIHCRTLIPEFYQRREFDRIWNPREISALLDVLENASKEGLKPSDYHAGIIRSFSAEANTTEEKADLEILCTDAFLLYASHFLNGKVNPETVDSEWQAVRREGNTRIILEDAVQRRRIAESLRELTPGHRSYANLKTTLASYTSIAAEGGWKMLPEGTTLKKDMMDSVRIPVLIDRLFTTGDLKVRPESKVTYGPAIENAIRNFQERHGLDVDGNLGKMTVEALNIPVESRIDQIRINLERYRWISQELGDHYILVNIADFKMEVYRKNQLTYQEKVIVGKTYRKTPVFSGKMTYLVFNPYWTVPPTILFNDILPELQKDPGYLAPKNIRVYDGYGSDAKIIDPTSVNWSSYSRGNFPFVLRQDPGPVNALGRVKFMFPNKYNVYIHDTPSRELFSRTERAFSSGCIRLNNPLDFVTYLAEKESSLQPSGITKLLDGGMEKTVILENPLNVHILYLTSWADKENVHFRKDLYARDQPVLNALNATPPQI